MPRRSVCNGKIAFSVAEVAKLTGVHQNTVKNWEKRGEIRVIRIGARIFIPRHELERQASNLRGLPLMESSRQHLGKCPRKCPRSVHRFIGHDTASWRHRRSFAIEP